MIHNSEKNAKFLTFLYYLVMIRLPQEFTDNMKELLKDEFDDYMSCLDKPVTHSLRINTNKISINDFLKINPFNLKKIAWTTDGFYYDDNDLVSKHPYYHAGLYYLQEASAMLPAETLPIEENDIVLDACAAPGGKSLKLANRLNNTGVLISNDISSSRAQVLLNTLESCGIKNSYIMAEDITKLTQLDNCFDKILVDAPCSGEGMFRKDPSLIKSWLEKNNNYYQPIQKQILDKAVTMLKPGGIIVYSTCTFSKKENEDVIEYILDKYSDLEVLPIKKLEGFEDGLTQKTRACVRLYPHKVNGEGHFVAMLKKNGESKKDTKTNNNDKPEILPSEINMDFNNGIFINRDNRLYFEPLHDLNLNGLRIMRSGLLLGEYKHDKFEMSHALARALKYNEYNNVLNFPLDDNRVIKYLKCETLDVKDKYLDKTVLVCVDKYPLGFGIINKGILKNKYPANNRYK